MIETTKERKELFDQMNIEYIENKVKFQIELTLNENSININIIKKNSIPFINYFSNFSLEDLQNKSRFFKVFDYITEAYEDLKQRFIDKNYLLKSSEKKIILTIKTNVFKSDFNLEIPIKEQDISTIVKELCQIVQKQDKEIKEIMNF